MTSVALCSAKGSPGVSTLACVLGAVWPRSRRVLVAECDPFGNDMAANFDLSPLSGMTSLTVAGRRSSESAFDSHVQRLSGGLEVLVGPVSPDGARSLDRELGAAGGRLHSASADLVIDCGRLDPTGLGQRAVIRSADHILVLVRPDGAGIAHARAATAAMLKWNGTAPRRWFIAVGPSPFDDDDVDHAMGVPRLGTVPLDPVAAAMACGFPGRSRVLARSGVVHAARRIVARLLQDDESSKPDIAAPGPQIPTAPAETALHSEHAEHAEHAEYPGRPKHSEPMGGSVSATIHTASDDTLVVAE